MENIPALTDVLLYHVVSGEVLSSDLANGDMLTTLQGDNLTVTINGTVMINEATVTIPDVNATNGIIHVIDQVLVPEGVIPQDIVETAKTAGTFTTLVTALELTGLNNTLKSPGPFTVFAPTDDAFAALEAANPGIIAELIANPDALADILKYHVVAGELMSTDVAAQNKLLTLLGEYLKVDANSVIMINNAKIIVADIECSNGIIHVIDAVLVPEKEPIIEPIKDKGCVKIYKEGKYYLKGCAFFEAYPQKDSGTKCGTARNWIVKITVCARGWYKDRCGDWNRVKGELKMFYTAKCCKANDEVMYLKADGRCWSWNGMKLKGDPSNLKITVNTACDLEVDACGHGIRFWG